ncbi:acetyl-CoA C-acetyltransferase [Candidatus Bipolaricaulota bacterium]|nr:acetyl-CoA C-acetyltransferase [Candidatus Bipolaricaulota bacterium]
MKDPVIVSATRTPIGTFGGSLKDIKVSDLGSVVIEELLNKANLRPEIPSWVKASRPSVSRDEDLTDLERQYSNWDKDSKGIPIYETIMGNVLQGGQGMNTARQAAIRGGIPREIPAHTVNKVCGSGLKTIALAAEKISTGKADAIIAGGMENMSAAPYVLPDARWGYRMNPGGSGEIKDLMVHDGLYEIFHDYHMGNTAENIAEAFDISRRSQDELGAESHHRALRALEEGVFEDEIVPVEVPGQEEFFTTDEGPRETSVETMSDLPPAFQQEGTVTAGNSSGINDGAATVLVTSRELAQKLDLEVLASIKSWAPGAVEPRMMGLGPIAAVNRLRHNYDFSLEEVDVVELNEAFASQTLAVLKELGLPRYGESQEFTQSGSGKINPHGSGISLGHPVGATGARLVVTLVHELKRQKRDLGLATLCIGGGQGFAMLIERD